PTSSPVELKEFLGNVLQKMGMSHSGEHNPILQVKMCRGYAFVECTTAEDASNMINLCGITHKEHVLQIERTSKFEHGCDGVFYYKWKDILNLWESGELKMMTAGTKSSVIAIHNMATLEDLADAKKFLELIQDTRAECSRYGEVKAVIVPR